MKNFKNVFAAAASLTTIVASLLSPSLPKSGDYTFAATTTGCEVREEGRQSIASYARGKIVGDAPRDDSSARVVRIYTRTGHNSYQVGTGYEIGGKYILTAGHVDSKEGKPQILFSNKGYEGRFLKVDSKADIGLVEILSDRIEGSSGIRIGNIGKGDSATIKTLDPKDSRYLNGPESHKGVNLQRYDGLVPDANAKKQIRELEKALSKLEEERYSLETKEYKILKPYFDPDGKYMPVKEKKSPTRVNNDSAEKQSDDYNSYLGQTEADQLIPGMSGSAMFNNSGELVGVAINLRVTVTSTGVNSASGKAYIPGVPETVMLQADELSGKISALYDQTKEIKSRIDQLQNPIAPSVTYSGVSPKAIVGFLEEACAVKPVK